MSSSKIVIEFFLPTTSYLRISDAVQAIHDTVKEHRGLIDQTTVSGPFEGLFREESENVSISSTGRSPELGRSASSSVLQPPGNSSTSGVDPTKSARRGPGRPRKTEARPTPEPEQSSGSGAGQEAAGGRAEGPVEHVSRGPDQGAVQGGVEGQGWNGSDGGSGVDQRGATAPDRLNDNFGNSIPDIIEQELAKTDSWDDKLPRDEAVHYKWLDEPTGEEDEWADSPVEPQDFDEEWHAKAPGDEWPASLMPAGLSPQTIDRTQLNTLLGDHFRACGDKSRETTLALVERVTGHRSVGQVPPGEYWKLARCIVKDTKRYEHGLLKPKS